MAKRIAAKVPVASGGMLNPAPLLLEEELDADAAADELLGLPPEVGEAVALAMLDIMLDIMVLLAIMLLLLEADEPPPTAGSKADAFRLPHCSLDLQLANP